MNVLKKIFPMSTLFSKSVGMLIVGIVVHLLALGAISTVATIVPTVMSSIVGTVCVVLDLVLLGLATLLSSALHVVIWAVFGIAAFLASAYVVIGLVLLIVFFFQGYKLVRN